MFVTCLMRHLRTLIARKQGKRGGDALIERRGAKTAANHQQAQGPRSLTESLLRRWHGSDIVAHRIANPFDLRGVLAF